MDKVANMLITVKNGGNARREFVYIPFSKYIQSIAKCLLNNGFIAGYEKKKRQSGDLLEIKINYEDDKPRINGVKRISKPSRRLYASVREIYPVREGYGKLILSTPKGVLAGEDAKKQLVGGELLFEIW